MKNGVNIYTVPPFDPIVWKQDLADIGLQRPKVLRIISIRRRNRPSAASYFSDYQSVCAECVGNDAKSVLAKKKKAVVMTLHQACEHLREECVSYALLLL
jgi:hypothetical protein